MYLAYFYKNILSDSDIYELLNFLIFIVAEKNQNALNVKYGLPKTEIEKLNNLKNKF